ncbi:MAG: hypothetical protein IJM94_02410, partial [Clostridia bacterium]|nr:hypothetical protein [Clostridia bacterium]
MGDKPWEVMTAEEYDIYRNNKYKNENNQDADGKFHAENEALRKKYGIEDDSYSYDDLRYQSAYGINPYDNAARQNYRNIGKIRRRENPYKNELYNVADSLKNFKYDPESDNAFSAYKDAAIREGTAQRNKIYSDLTSMTGGRNNSWATAAVAQSGNATAQKIADIIPELSEKAYNKLLKMYDVRLNQYEVEE